jgi:hypothetical protein
MLRLCRENHASCREIGAATDQRSRAKVGTYADIFELRRQLQSGANASKPIAQRIQLDRRFLGRP